MRQPIRESTNRVRSPHFDAVKESTTRRILYVEGNVDATVGGSYYSLLFLVSGLDRTKYEPIVVFSAENDLLPQFHARGILTIVRPLLPPVVVATRLGRYISRVINFARGWVVEPCRLAVFLRRRRVSLVHLNNSIIKNHAWMLASLVARIPCITHERGINQSFLTRAILLARSLKAIICISTAVRDNFRSLGLGGLPLVTVHNGLDPNEMRVTRSRSEICAELGVAEDRRLVGMVGNIKEWKGQEVVVRAVAKVHDAFPNVVCVLIGDTSAADLDYRTRLDALIKELNLEDRVRITGYRKDVPNYINALDIQIHASIEPEPFGRVLLEGMALAKPLIASDGGAVPEIVVHGQTGLIFQSGNADGLAACLGELLASPSVAATMGQAGHLRLLRDFSIKQHVSEVQSIYDRVMA